jgi:hypothetical protein
MSEQSPFQSVDPSELGAEPSPEDALRNAKAEHARELSRFGSRVDAVLAGKAPEPVAHAVDAVVFADGTQMQLGRPDEHLADLNNRLRCEAAGLSPTSREPQRGTNAPQWLRTSWDRDGWGGLFPRR